MRPQDFSTQLLPLAHQFDAWCNWFDPVFEVVPKEPAEEGFPARSRIWLLDGCMFNRVSAPPVCVTRTRALIRRNPVDHWVITLSSHATTLLMTAGTWINAPPKSPFAVSLADELISDRAQDERLQLYLNRDSFREIVPLLDASRGRPLDGHLSNLLAEYMILLERNLPKLTTDDLPPLKAAISTMIAACIVPTPDRIAAAESQIDLGRLERVRRVVRNYLRSPLLGTELICRHLGISRSPLYRLLESEGGVARFIQRQRLRESCAALCDSSHNRLISKIAREFCFSDATSFSRAFKNEFGVTPREMRTASRARHRPRPKPTETAAPVANLKNLLRSF